MRVEDSDTAVTFTGAWTRSDSSWGWSGGSAVQSNAAGATASITFTGNSVRWIGSRGRGMGIAMVSVDAGPSREVGRKDSQAEGNVVVVDALDVQPGTTVSHWQDTNPDLKFSVGWTKSDIARNWSGTGVSNVPELPVSAQETQTAGEIITLPFRGTAAKYQPIVFTATDS
jgi:hypothetical protein